MSEIKKCHFFKNNLLYIMWRRENKSLAYFLHLKNKLFFWFYYQKVYTREVEIYKGLKTLVERKTFYIHNKGL